MTGKNDVDSHREKAPPSRQPTKKDDVPKDERSKDEHHVPGAEGETGADAEEDTYD